MLIDRMNLIEKRSRDAETNLTEAERKMKATVSSINTSQKGDLGDLRTHLEGKMNQQHDQLTSKFAELVDKDSHLENELRKSSLLLRE
jgi:hypothetical protein